MPIAIGTSIGPYEVLGWIGAGGMGEVYRARDPRLGRDVAIKVISEKFAADPSRMHRFEQEARAAGQINHPNILAVYDIGSHAGTSYIVSELLEGESLGSRLKAGALPPRKAVDYARQTAEGLAAAHDKSLVHRDLKPDNLFITHEGRVKILDFGIAKLALPSDDAERATGFATETAAGMVVGSAGYMSPEQVRGQAVDVRSDLFSFGAVFYEMLSGRPAFIRETGPETMAAILKEDPPDPLDATVPSAVVQIISRCLEKSREARFQSARDLAFALQFLAGTTGTAATTSASVRRRRPRLGVVLVVVSILAAIASWVPWRTPAQSVEDVLIHAQMSLLTDWDGAEEGAEISPDGKLVAFLSDHDGEWDIWLHQIGTGGLTNLTKDFPPLAASGFVVRKLGFSADSSEIWFNPGDGLALMSVPWGGGTPPHPFLPAGTNTPAWSPDSHVLYVDKAAAGDPLYVADRNGADPKQILGPDKFKNMNPVYSQDGKWIYFARGLEPMDELSMDVWRLPSSGGTPEQLSNQHLAINFLAPFDSRTLLYAARAEDRSGPWLWAFDLDRRTSHRVPLGVHHFTSVSVSRDGQRIVGTIANPSASLWSVPISNRIAKEDDARPYALSAPTGQATAPRFGQNALFYLSGLGTPDGLWRDQGGQASNIWRGVDGPLSEPAAISPDGTRVVVVVRREGKRHLTIMNADGTGAKTLAGSIEIDGAAGQGAADWAPDGKRIVTAGHDEKGSALFVIAADTGAATRLLEGAWVNPVWSPKGDLIVCRSTKSILGQVTVRGVKEDGTVVELPFMTRPGGYRFLPNGSGVVYQPHVQGLDFWLFEFASGKSHQLAQLDNKGALRTFDITRDGKSIIFDRSRQNSNVVLIELPK